MMSQTMARTAALFQTPVGQPIDASAMPKADYLHRGESCDVEGQWVFCVFDHPEILAGRFGFTHGSADFTDYGAPARKGPSWMQATIELITRQGAVLWHGADLFDGREVQSDPAHFGLDMQADGKPLFHAAGWPNPRWTMTCPSADLGLDLTLELEQAIVLPDAVLSRIVFSMWWAPCAIHGHVRLDGRTIPLRGRAFYDHPRIVSREHEVPAFGFYHYTPIVLADGSALCSYFARDRDNHVNPDYSFAYWFRPGKPPVALSSAELSDMTFDSDRQPQQWRQRWEAEGIQIEGVSRVRPIPIARLWGGPTITHGRYDNAMIPLLFDSELTIREERQTRQVTGRGVAEFVIHPDLSLRLIGPRR